MVPVTRPMTDQFIAINSEDNVTYNCSVDSGNVVVWEVERSQIRSNDQFMDIENLGFVIDPSNTLSNFSTITISPPARTGNSEILIQCLSSRGINSIEGEIYSVVTFGKAILICKSYCRYVLLQIVVCTHPLTCTIW